VTREPCVKGTRDKILKEIIGWAEDASTDSPPVYWLTGQAGSGKTSIAYTITQHFDKIDRAKGPERHTVLGGDFLCSRQFEETKRRVYIIPTLVHQLARKSRSFANALHSTGNFDSIDKLSYQMEDLLVGPWHQSDNARRTEIPPYLIVVDALDEIEDRGGYNFLRELLDEVNSRKLRGLKFLVTSRTDPDLVELCDSFASKAVCRLQEVPTEEVESDIRTYLHVKLPALMSEAELVDVAKRAGGLFIYAATVVRYLTPRHKITLAEQRTLMKKLFSQSFASSSAHSHVDGLYKHVLQQAFSGLDGEILDSRLRILHTFLCTVERTPASVAADLLSQPPEVAEAVLSELYAVLYAKDGQILWYHASFPDFIFSETRSRVELGGEKIDMSCNVTGHNALLARSCLEMMAKKLHFNIAGISSSFLLDSENVELKQRVEQNITADLQYACYHWAQHVDQAESMDTNTLGNLIKNLFPIQVLFWVEAMNLLLSSGRCTQMLQRTHKWVLEVRISELRINCN